MFSHLPFPYLGELPIPAIMSEKSREKSDWAIGGCTLIGLGVGMIYLKTSVLLFFASLLIGIGVGLVLTALISAIHRR